MRAVILAAGYATRLYPVTRDRPKALLEVGGRTILDWLVESIEEIPEIGVAHLVTNHRFAGQFSMWRDGYRGRLAVDLLDDGTTDNETRRGAIGDLELAIEARGLAEDLLVCAADNLLRFSLADLAGAFRARPDVWICVRELRDLEARRRTGIAVVSGDGRVLEFAEKPGEPRSCWAVPPVYLLPVRVLPLVAEHLAAGGSPDAPGHLLASLCGRSPMWAHFIQGTVMDIGNAESLERARAEWNGRAR